MDTRTISFLVICIIIILRVIIKNKKNRRFSSSEDIFNLEHMKLLKQIDDYYEKLSKEEKEKYDTYQQFIAIVQLYYDEVMNGGLYQYFANSSRVDVSKLSKCLKEIDAKKHKKHFDNFVKQNKIDVNNLTSFMAKDVDEYLDKNQTYPFEKFDIKFYEIEEEENLNDLINEYAQKSFSKLFPEFDEKIDFQTLDIDEFVKKYDELASCFPKYLTSDNRVLNVLLEFRAKQLFELNNRLKLNDDFVHKVINKLMKSKNIGTFCEISVMAVCIGYKTDKAISNIKQVFSTIKDPSYMSHVNFVLHEHAGITIVKK